MNKHSNGTSMHTELLRGLLAASAPQAYALYEAPEGARLPAMKEALKWTLLGAVPTRLAFPEKGWLPALAAGTAAGIKGADSAIQAHKSRARSKRIEALVEALGNRFVPAKIRNEIEGLPKASEDVMNRELLYVLSKVAVLRKLSQSAPAMGTTTPVPETAEIEATQNRLGPRYQRQMGTAPWKSQTPPTPAAAPAPGSRMQSGFLGRAGSALGNMFNKLNPFGS